MVASLLLPTAVGNQPSLGLSPDGLHAVVAGQHVLQTISLSAEDGSMACEENLVPHKLRQHPNLNCKDVQWHPQQATQLATGSSSGTVLLWNLEGRVNDKLSRTLTGHTRAVNRVCYVPQEASRLLSGSQDCTVKQWDTRVRFAQQHSYRTAAEVRDEAVVGGGDGGCGRVRLCQATYYSRPTTYCLLGARRGGVAPQPAELRGGAGERYGAALRHAQQQGPAAGAAGARRARILPRLSSRAARSAGDRLARSAAQGLALEP